MTKEGNGITKGLLIGIFAGVAVGSIIALLFAPKSGDKLAKELKQNLVILPMTPRNIFRMPKRKYRN